MAIIGMNIETIEAKKNSKNVGRMTVSTSPTIKDVSEIDVPSIGKKALDIKFEYVCKYQSEDKKAKDIASIKVTGNVLFLGEDNSKVIKEWKDKKIPKEVAVPVLNHVLRKCITKSMGITEDLQLPPPIRFPIVKASGEQAKV